MARRRCWRLPLTASRATPYSWSSLATGRPSLAARWVLRPCARSIALATMTRTRALPSAEHRRRTAGSSARAHAARRHAQGGDAAVKRRQAAATTSVPSCGAIAVGGGRTIILGSDGPVRAWSAAGRGRTSQRRRLAPRGGDLGCCKRRSLPGARAARRVTGFAESEAQAPVGDGREGSSRGSRPSSSPSANKPREAGASALQKSSRTAGRACLNESVARYEMKRYAVLYEARAMPSQSTLEQGDAGGDCCSPLGATHKAVRAKASVRCWRPRPPPWPPSPLQYPRREVRLSPASAGTAAASPPPLVGPRPAARPKPRLPCPRGISGRRGSAQPPRFPALTTCRRRRRDSGGGKPGRLARGFERSDHVGASSSCSRRRTPHLVAAAG